MGLGFKGDTGHHHTILENLSSLKSEFPYKNGYFGCPGKGRSFIRNIVCNDPIKTAKQFYEKAALGGIEKQMANGKGVYTKMKDGTILSYREASSSDGTPVVEINIKNSNDHGDVKYQKIHFVKGK